MAKKSEKKESMNKDLLRKSGKGILRFFEMVFKFILDLLRLLPALFKAIVLVILLGMLAALLAAVIFYIGLSALGLKDSPAFQNYREAMIDKMVIDSGWDIGKKTDNEIEE